MSADILRDAAKVLRERAKDATPGPWHVDEVGDFGDKGAALEIAQWRGYTNTVNFGEDRATAAYIATVHPGVGIVLADWLDDAASWEDVPRTVNHDMRAHDLARLILGGAS